MKNAGRSLLLLLAICVTHAVHAQEITEENYLKADSALWMQYEKEQMELFKFRQQFPEKKDSIKAVQEKSLESALNKNKELAIEYASAPSGLKRVFMVRRNIPKDTLRAILSGLSGDILNSPYVESIRLHINSEQIKEGSKYYDFQATDSEGKPFTLSSLEGKNILFIYGGLDCMGAEGRKFLELLHEKTDPDVFKIVVYCISTNTENLRKVRTKYACNYTLVSDFLGDHTPVKILYGTQATPTCFFINKQGIVEMKTEGLDEDRVNQLLGRK